MKKLIILLLASCSALSAHIDPRLEQAVKTTKINEVKELLQQSHLTKNEQKTLLIIAKRRVDDLDHTIREYTKPEVEYETKEYDQYYRETGRTTVTEKKKHIARRTDIHFVPPHDEGTISLWGLGGLGAFGIGGYGVKQGNNYGWALIIPGVIALLKATIMYHENESAYRQQLQCIHQDALDIEIEIQKKDTY